jgi:hypothetical protein
MMPNNELDQLKYPIGKFEKPDNLTAAQVSDWINEIELLPVRLKDLTENLTSKELAWRYRPGGWTIQQVVHHIADSHLNSFIRYKLTLTEAIPTIKPYFEERWAELPDSTRVPISASIKILEGLHARWIHLLRALNMEDLKKTFIHPARGRQITLGENLTLYAWHSNHHLAHIRQALEHHGEWGD